MEVKHQGIKDTSILVRWGSESSEVLGVKEDGTYEKCDWFRSYRFLSDLKYKWTPWTVMCVFIWIDSMLKSWYKVGDKDTGWMDMWMNEPLNGMMWIFHPVISHVTLTSDADYYMIRYLEPVIWQKEKFKESGWSEIYFQFVCLPASWPWATDYTTVLTLLFTSWR